MVNKWLTALQADFLSGFFASETAQAFFLTGGTALAAYYLHHRASVDIYFILDAGYDFDDLLEKATEKDLGLQRFYLAASLLQVRKLHHIPETEPALEPGELQNSMVALAESLIDRSKPPE